MHVSSLYTLQQTVQVLHSVDACYSYLKKVSIMPEMNMFPGTWKDILPMMIFFFPDSGLKAES